MTRDKQHIAIATYMGYSLMEDEATKGKAWSRFCLCKDGVKFDWHLYPGLAWTDTPDYLNDLNAMASAEATLSDREFFGSYIERYCYTQWLNVLDLSNKRALTSATAKVRAEAFLRTLGLFED
jgi:hypothetical protein